MSIWQILWAFFFDNTRILLVFFQDTFKSVLAMINWPSSLYNACFYSCWLNRDIALRPWQYLTHRCNCASVRSWSSRGRSIHESLLCSNLNFQNRYLASLGVIKEACSVDLEGLYMPVEKICSTSPLWPPKTTGWCSPFVMKFSVSKTMMSFCSSRNWNFHSNAERFAVD